LTYYLNIIIIYNPQAQKEDVQVGVEPMHVGKHDALNCWAIWLYIAAKYTETNATVTRVRLCDSKQTENGSHVPSTNHNGTQTSTTTITTIDAATTMTTTTVTMMVTTTGRAKTRRTTMHRVNEEGNKWMAGEVCPCPHLFYSSLNPPHHQHHYHGNSNGNDR
jgi:hypothetical protein